MAEPDVIETVKAYLAAGKTEDEIAAALLNAGHGADEASEAISAARSGAPAPAAQIPPSASIQAPAPAPVMQPSAAQPQGKGLNFGILPSVLYQPKQAFEKIKEGTTLGSGLVMFVILAAISQIILEVPVISKIGNDAIAIVVALALSVVGILLIGAVSSLIAGAFGGKKDIQKTIGMLGYGQVLGIVQAVASVVLFMAAGITLTATGIMSIAAAAGIGTFFIIVFFVWGLWVNGSAVAVANDTTLVKGAVSYFIAALAVTWLMGVIAALLVYSAVGAAPAVPTG